MGNFLYLSRCFGHREREQSCNARGKRGVITQPSAGRTAGRNCCQCCETASSPGSSERAGWLLVGARRGSARTQTTQAAAKQSFLLIKRNVKLKTDCHRAQRQSICPKSSLRARENTSLWRFCRGEELTSPGQEKAGWGSGGRNSRELGTSLYWLPLFLKTQFIFTLVDEFTTSLGNGRELPQDELSTQQKFPLVNAFPLIPFCCGKLRKQKENRARQLLTWQNSQKCQEELGSDHQVALGLRFFLQTN